MTHRSVNVSASERLLSLGVGALLTWQGVKQRSLGGTLIAAGGASLIYRGASGSCALYKALGISTAKDDQADTKMLLHSIEINLPERALLQLARDHTSLLLANDQTVRLVEPLIGQDDREFGFIWECGERRGEVRILATPRPQTSVLRLQLPGITGKLPRTLAQHYVKEGLRRFKMWAEAGEVATVAGQAHGQRGTLGTALLGLKAAVEQRSGGLWPVPDVAATWPALEASPNLNLQLAQSSGRMGQKAAEGRT